MNNKLEFITFQTGGTISKEELRKEKRKDIIDIILLVIIIGPWGLIMLFAIVIPPWLLFYNVIMAIMNE